MRCFFQSMDIRKKSIFLLLAVVFSAFLFACTKKEEMKKSDAPYIFCVNTSETQVVGEQTKLESTKLDDQIQEFLKKLKQDPRNISLKKAIADDMELNEYTINSGDLCLYWTAAYTNYTGVSEVLRRAAIVKTFCQLKGVKTVEFYVSGQPLTDSNMDAIGFMTADTFIDNTGEQIYTQKITLNVYFSNKDGKALKKVPISVTYDASIPIEQLVLEQLLKGPEKIKGLKKEDLKRTISETVKFNKISVKENTCYLDISNDFLDKPADISDEVTVYSIVNSLTELSNINRVQFSIDGEQVLSYDDKISLGDSLEVNYDLIEE